MRYLKVIGLAVCLVAGTSAALATQEKSQQNRDDKRGRGSGSENQVMVETRFLSVVRTDLTRLEIDWVALTDGLNTEFADAADGISQDDQDRVDLSFIPFFGKATKTRYTADDVSAETRVGSAWFLDRILYVALDPARAAIGSLTSVVVLNDKWAYTLVAAPTPVDWASNPAFDPIRDVPVFRDFAMTNVILPDAQSILIGGLDSAGAQEKASKVPVLGDIPLLGRMFAGSAHRKDESTLLILLRPSVIVSDDN